MYISYLIILFLGTTFPTTTITIPGAVRGRFRCGFEGCDYKTDRMYNFKRHMFAVHLKNDKSCLFIKKKKSKPVIILPREEAAVFADPLAFP